ncbi:MAG: hypothetical protein RMJ97_03140 [Raineya sp.]|nr:hypothetical protein [Raineya sp.]MDW8295857.1 hypothetical protein [Raineya sp.]
MEYYRASNIQNFLVRRTNAVKNHIFAALRAFILLEEKVINQVIANWYQFRENLPNCFLKQNLT